ncbi:MAG: HTTM domain-containing protein [Deltaproteobacteria bacterium]|nr:HTTM domain-containing protein [Deltaproteobacteria bacterium]
MNLETAVRSSEILMGLAFLQQSAEHLPGSAREWLLFVPRMGLALLLIVGVQPAIVEGLLLFLGVAILQRFHGPYNGGSDRMSLLLLCALFMSHLAPTRWWQEIVIGYLAVQLLLSYTISGWIKLVNPDWRSGQALQDIFEFSVYPVSESIRALARAPVLLLGLSWTIMLFEILFPLALLDGTYLKTALVVAGLFHLVNGCVFGLNRFLWIWIAAYPCLLWFQQRVAVYSF